MGERKWNPCAPGWGCPLETQPLAMPIVGLCGWGLYGRGMESHRSCPEALYQITLPFSLLWHICSYYGCLLSARVVVMKSLYLHKVIVHVIKKKKLY